MTIQEAVERAKRLGQARKREAEATQGRKLAPTSDDTGSLATLRDGVRGVPQPVDGTPFGRVEFDAAACKLNRVFIEREPEDSQAAAAYRLLRGRTQHRMKDRNWSCIGITSAGPGEGKTVTTLNLAISIAREKQLAVYVVDLDMRSPSMLEYLGVRPPRPLSSFFAEGADAQQVFFSTPIENLMVAGNREPVASASELLATSRLEELLDFIRRRSSGALILIDLPPVISTDEALVVGPRVDAMFLVVSEGVTRRDALKRSIDLLGDCPVAGIILNRASEGFGGEYYSY